MLRPSGRKIHEIRDIEIQTNINKYAEGSCLIKWGGTHVICTATVENKVPRFLKNTGKGWVTAEYSMLPRSTDSRIQRDITKGKLNGRGSEIQRLIGRSLRAGIDMRKIGEKQIIIDCDVIQADGGTRCASIVGGFVAMYMAVQKMIDRRMLRENPIIDFISAVSCGIYKNVAVADLDYPEDSNCEADVNFVVNGSSEIIEVQGTAEQKPFSYDKFTELYQLASDACVEINNKQKEALGLLKSE